MAHAMKLTKLIPAIALAAGAFTANTATAADLLLDPPPIYEAPEVAVASNSGWYLRGDITYDLRSSISGTYYDVGTFATTSGQSFTSNSLEDSYDLGFGIGYQITDYLRADVTGEYVFGATWTGTSYRNDASTANGFGMCPNLQTAGGGLVGNFSGDCTSVDTANVAVFKLLGNAYLDLGKFGGFTPYIGAGIGGAYVMYDDYRGTETSSGCGGVGGACAPNSTNTSVHEGLSSWRFAYALHAGASYDVSQSWKIDLGYSYTDIAGGAIANAEGGTKPFAYDEGFSDHVFRAGLRYQIW